MGEGAYFRGWAYFLEIMVPIFMVRDEVGVTGKGKGIKAVSEQKYGVGALWHCIKYAK